MPVLSIEDGRDARPPSSYSGPFRTFDRHCVGRRKLKVHISSPDFPAGRSNRKHQAVSTLNLKQFRGTVKCLAQNLRAQAYGRAAAGGSRDADIFRTQREQAGAVAQSGPPGERVAARHSILYFAAEQIGVADELG